MISQSFISQTKTKLIANLVIGILLLVTGVIMTSLSINLVNTKAVVGLSFIPLAMAFSQAINLMFVRKYPREMRPLIMSHNDERLIAERNATEAKAFQIFRWLLNLVFIAYTLMVPRDIFVAIGWWIIMGLFVLSILLPLIMIKRTPKEA